jgi:hypothetical protein
LLSNHGVIGGGRSGKDVSFENSEIRGDVFGYFDGTEEIFSQTKTLSRVLEKMVRLLSILI